MLSQKQNAETEDILLDAVRNDPDPGVRGQAVFWLSQVPGERSLKAIENVLSTEYSRFILPMPSVPSLRRLLAKSRL